MLCMACLRFKFSPIHWVVRLIGICPGDRMPGGRVSMAEIRFDGRKWDNLGERGNLLAGERWRYTGKHGQVRHRCEMFSWDSYCGLHLCEREWSGTGNQAEYERLASLPKCLKCMKARADKVKETP